MPANAETERSLIVNQSSSRPAPIFGSAKRVKRTSHCCSGFASIECQNGLARLRTLVMCFDTLVPGRFPGSNKGTPPVMISTNAPPISSLFRQIHRWRRDLRRQAPRNIFAPFLQQRMRVRIIVLMVTHGRQTAPRFCPLQFRICVEILCEPVRKDRRGYLTLLSIRTRTRVHIRAQPTAAFALDRIPLATGRDVPELCKPSLTVFDPDQGRPSEMRIIRFYLKPKEPVMDAFQIPFVALFSGMVLAFAAVMLYGTINEYSRD